MAMNIKKGDSVVVLSGKDKGKQGKVQAVIPGEQKVVVEGVNMVTCHTKPRRQGEEGGIVRREAALVASKVQLLCPKCGKPTRVGSERVKKTVSGKEKMMGIRVCKKCGAKDI